MKTGIKIMGLFAWLTIIIGTGYFCVMTNLNGILDAGKMDCHVFWQSGRLILKTGKWAETVYIIPDVKSILSGIKGKTRRETPAAKETTMLKTKMATPGKKEKPGRW